MMETNNKAEEQRRLASGMIYSRLRADVEDQQYAKRGAAGAGVAGATMLLLLGAVFVFGFMEIDFELPLLNRVAKEDAAVHNEAPQRLLPGRLPQAGQLLSATGQQVLQPAYGQVPRQVPQPAYGQVPREVPAGVSQQAPSQTPQQDPNGMPYQSCVSLKKPPNGGSKFCETRSPAGSPSPMCPFLHHGSSCGLDHTAQILARARTDLGLLTMDQYARTREQWLSFARDKHILFIGDSVTANLAEALMCLLVDATTGERVELVTVYPGATFFLTNGKTGIPPKDGPIDTRDFCIRYRSGSGSVCMLTAQGPIDLDKRAKVFTKKMFPIAHTVVLNAGLHLHGKDDKGNVKGMESFFQHLGYKKGAQGPEGGKQPVLIWREGSPQHFGWPNGQYIPDGINSNSAAFKKKVQQWDAAGSNCMPHEAGAKRPKLDSAFDALARDYGIPVMPVFARTAPLFFAHPPHPGDLHPDCTHYCLPGAPDLWVQWLLEYLQQELKVT